MKVKELIRELKKMPPNLQVGIAAHDDSEWGISGWTNTVIHHRKADYAEEYKGGYERLAFGHLPNEWVTIHC